MAFNKDHTIKKLLFVTLSLSASLAFSEPFPKDSPRGSICGNRDDRVLSDVSPVARLMKTSRGSAGCSGTMISETCMVTAGHCHAYLNFAQFNVPTSDPETGRVNYPQPENEYPLDHVFSWNLDTFSSDWAVIRLKVNPLTGLTAGEVQGFYPVDFSRPRHRTTIRITGYGSDREKAKNFSQQTHTGPLTSVSSGSASYTVDTMPGNSGSSLLRESDGKIIGVHTNGGCGWGSNSGTLFYGNRPFQRAVKKCLNREKESL